MAKVNGFFLPAKSVYVSSVCVIVIHTNQSHVFGASSLRISEMRCKNEMLIATAEIFVNKRHFN